MQYVKQSVNNKIHIFRIRSILNKAEIKAQAMKENLWEKSDPTRQT